MTLMDEVAKKYSDAIAAAESSGVAAEPEAQLTVPVHDLFVAVSAAADLGSLQLLREAQLLGVRPDFAALVDGIPCGWVELKAPGHSLDGAEWKGREKKQWALLSELDALIVTNGEEAALYTSGEFVRSATLPVNGPEDWDPAPLTQLLQLMTTMRPATIVRVSQLAARLAPLARLLRERIEVGVAGKTVRVPLQQAWEAWRIHVHEGATGKAFANDLAQVVAYSLAIAALRGDADTNHDRRITLSEARSVLRGPNDVLAAALGPAMDVPGLLEELAPEIGAIERLASVVDPARVAKSNDSRGEPWLWFYEDFLATYDPAARKEAGVYYTPTDVVEAQVRLVDHILTDIFEKPLSFGDGKVVTLDPASGSGTYPLAVLDRAADVAIRERGAAGPRQVVGALASNLIAFELMPGPYAVAHLRIGQRLAELGDALTPPQDVRVYLTDTLDDPAAEPLAPGLFGDMAILAKERSRASTVKRDQPVTVVMGNPPYARRSAASGGGWVLHPTTGRSLFADVIEPAQQTKVIFSAQASLYNDYVYFWRWALWKAFEQDPTRPAVVSFITAASWLNGPAFVGLRRLARIAADEMWIIDLGGEGRGANTDENVFAIQTPVAIVTLYRKAAATATPATVHYQRVHGTRNEKLAKLRSIEAPALTSGEWEVLDLDADAALIPLMGGDTWSDLPALTDLFPWQQPGAMFNRAWPIAPSQATLSERWNALLDKTSATDRAQYFVTGSSGRTIHTQVAGLPRLSELPNNAPHREIVKYGYRSFDRQWTFRDPRLAKTESPALWRSLSDKQLFLSSLLTSALGEGPALTVTTAVPDKHHFRGSAGGKDVIPLYRDGYASVPNVPAGLLEVLGDSYGKQVTVEDLAAYVYALLAHPGYHETFHEALQSPGPRVPITSEASLFAEVVELGRRLLWLHTYSERYQNSTADRPNRIPAVEGQEWTTAVATIPKDTAAIRYDEATHTLHIGDGTITNVLPEVWNYSVSGFRVVERWIGSRTAKGVGLASRPKTATPLDKIRPTTWEDEWNDELLELLRVLTHTLSYQPAQQVLLDSVVTGELIPVDALPQPTPADRTAPAR